MQPSITLQSSKYPYSTELAGAVGESEITHLKIGRGGRDHGKGRRLKELGIDGLVDGEKGAFLNFEFRFWILEGEGVISGTEWNPSFLIFGFRLNDDAV